MKKVILTETLFLNKKDYEASRIQHLSVNLKAGNQKN